MEYVGQKREQICLYSGYHYKSHIWRPWPTKLSVFLILFSQMTLMSCLLQFILIAFFLI